VENFKAGDLVEVTRGVGVLNGWTASKGTLGIIIKPWQRKHGKLYVVHLQAGHKGLIPKNYLKRAKCLK